MGRIRRSLLSAGILAGAAAFGWNLLLDERARASVRRALVVSGSLANHLIAGYLGTAAEASTDEAAAARNRSWVEQQWSEVGY